MKHEFASFHQLSIPKASRTFVSVHNLREELLETEPGPEDEKRMIRNRRFPFDLSADGSNPRRAPRVEYWEYMTVPILGIRDRSDFGNS